MAQMLINQDSKLEQIIEDSKTDSNTKNAFLEKLKIGKDKFRDKLEDEAISFVINTAKEYSLKAIPIIMEMIRQSH